MNGEAAPVADPLPSRKASAAEPWTPRHVQLAVAYLHRVTAAELEAGRWPMPVGAMDLDRFGRAEFIAVLTRLRDGVLPSGEPTTISPIFASIDVEEAARKIESRVFEEQLQGSPTPPRPR